MLDFLHPNLLALISATLIACARVAQRYAVSRLSTYAVNLLMGMVTASAGWFFYWLEGGLDRVPLTGVLWFIAMGFFGGFAGRYLMMLSMNLTGLARAAVMSQTVLIWSPALAVGVLGERMTIRVALGTLAIMVGAILLVYRESPEARKRIPLHYYLVPALSAFMYACAHLTGKFAFAWIPSSAFGMAVANTASLALVMSMMPFKKKAGLGSWEWKGLAALLAGAVIQAAGILFFWSSVKLGEVTQVIPLSRLSLLLIIFLSWLLFREQESVTWRVVAGGLMALAGAFAVAG